MQTVLIVIHLMIVIAMIAVILLQRSEGGALGIGGGGGGGGGGMFSARGSANLLTRTTTILAVVFFATSLGLGLLAKSQQGGPSILDTGTTGPADASAPLGNTEGTGEGLLDTLREQSGEPAVPAPPTDDGGASAVPTEPGAPTVPGTPGSPQVPTGQ